MIATTPHGPPNSYLKKNMRRGRRGNEYGLDVLVEALVKLLSFL
jgi:hypothetical protein